MTRDDVQRWLDRYAEAWRTYDPDLIRALFSADAEQYDHPWEEPVRGADAIADDWLADAERARHLRGVVCAVRDRRQPGGRGGHQPLRRREGQARVPQRLRARVRRQRRMPLVQGLLHPRALSRMQGLPGHGPARASSGTIGMYGV